MSCYLHPLAKSSSSPRSPSQFSHPNLPPEDPSSRKITSSPFPSQTHTKGPTTARIPLEGSRITTTYYSQRHDERCQTGVEAKRSGTIVGFLERERTTRVNRKRVILSARGKSWTNGTQTDCGPRRRRPPRDFFLRLLRAQQRFRARTKPIRGRNCRRPTSAGRVGTPLINREGLHSSAPDHHGSLLDRRVPPPPPPPPRLEASRRRARSRWRETPRNRGAGGAIPEAARTNGGALAIRRVRGTRGTMLPPRGAPPNETERASDQPPPPQSRPRRRGSSGAAASRPPPSPPPSTTSRPRLLRASGTEEGWEIFAIRLLSCLSTRECF